ncbi:MAG: hypothetical protein A2Z18_07450 [Armatimonadetes bacterium RBG_16_58_9]|nr:MAG: hypothetical protein A2Z18_07450 [Armatimonadetes bacterium RBG_16_58_9]
MDGRGTLKTASKTISYSSINIRPNGELKGTKSSVVKDQQDTSLATYNFEGTLSFRGKLDAVKITADGTVRRSGKIANKTTTHRVSKTPVDASTGQCEVNIGGGNVTFNLL